MVGCGFGFFLNPFMLPLEESQCAAAINPKRMCKDLKNLILFIVLPYFCVQRNPKH